MPDVTFNPGFKATAEISPNGRRIEVRFEATDDESWDDVLKAVRIAKLIPGATFRKKDKTEDGIPFWHYPLEMESCNQIRKAYGDHLKIGKFLKAWAKERVQQDKKLRSISQAGSAKLEIITEMLPELAEAIHLGPAGLMMDDAKRAEMLAADASYQAADVSFMTFCQHPINANQPGTGKTIETIASIFESALDDGPNLVIAPVTSINTVWVEHLEKWQPHPVLTATGGRVKRLDELEDAQAMFYDGFPFFLVINPDMVAVKSEFNTCSSHKRAKVSVKRECQEMGGECMERFIDPYPILHEINWNTVVIDEFHKMGLANQKTMAYRGMKKLRENCQKVMALSGTPIGGKIIKLWGILHFLYPEEFSSKWRFGHQWMKMEQGWNGQPKIGEDLADGREEEFWEMLSSKMVRRTKAEVLPWLPPKMQIPVWAEMDEKQSKQYEEFAKDAEIRIEGELLSAPSILAEYTRLKQFAMGVQRLEKYIDDEGEQKVRPIPTTESCKIPHVLRILEELGIVAGSADSEEAGGDEQVVIFSQFTTVIDMLTTHLNEIGIKSEKITGAVTSQNRDRIIRQFQSPTGPRVLLMNVQAGGTAITLDKASTAIFLDQTWNPDDKEQAEDRIHRGSRIHQVTIYTIRTRGTVEEYIETVNLGKESVNFNILDARRMGLRATGNLVEDGEED